jgi:hypothetical protein
MLLLLLVLLLRLQQQQLRAEQWITNDAHARHMSTEQSVAMTASPKEFIFESVCSGVHDTVAVRYQKCIGHFPCVSSDTAHMLYLLGVRTVYMACHMNDTQDAHRTSYIKESHAVVWLSCIVTLGYLQFNDPTILLRVRNLYQSR